LLVIQQFYYFFHNVSFLRPVLARAGFVIFLITATSLPQSAKSEKPTVGFPARFFLEGLDFWK
jgi:hypothetical protein